MYPEWRENLVATKDISREIRVFLIENVKNQYELSYEEFNNLHGELFDYIKNVDYVQNV